MAHVMDVNSVPTAQMDQEDEPNRVTLSRVNVVCKVQVYIRPNDFILAGVVCPVMACWTSIPEWSLGRSAHACSITCSGVAVGGHSRSRPRRPVAVSLDNPTTRYGFLPHREAHYLYASERAFPHFPKTALLSQVAIFLFSFLRFYVFEVINFTLFKYFSCIKNKWFFKFLWTLIELR